MSVTSTIDSGELVAFVERATREFTQAERVLKDTRTLSATNTFQAFQRVPGTELIVALSAPSPWAASREIQPVVVTFDGDVLHGDHVVVEADNKAGKMAFEVSKRVGEKEPANVKR